jgi:hypothetical protein
MHSVVECRSFSSRASGKFASDEIDQLIGDIATNPRIGKRVSGTGNLYQHHFVSPGQRKFEYDVYYVYVSRSYPVLLVCILKRGTKAALDKVLETLALELLG